MKPCFICVVCLVRALMSFTLEWSGTIVALIRFSILVNFSVFPKRTTGWKGRKTNFTFIRLFTSMDSLVRCQGALISKLGWAKVALICFFFTVDSFVDFQGVFPNEGWWTLITLERFFISMDSSVLGQTVAIKKIFETNLTFKWPFSSVCSFVAC